MKKKVMSNAWITKDDGLKIGKALDTHSRKTALKKIKMETGASIRSLEGFLE